MAFLLDTNVAIHLRDADPDVAARVAALTPPIVISIISQVELEGGVHADAARSALRRSRLDVMLHTIEVLPFGAEEAHAYGTILKSAGYSRRKVFDRMIAAQALVHRATLVTCNGEDFRDIPGLRLEVW